MELTPGTVLERYTVDGVLGRGGMAVVYRVHHNQLGSPHAMKVLTLPTRAIRKRLMQEGRVQSALRHPNVVAVTDIVEVDGCPALVMEYVRGPSLSDFLSTCRPSRAQADALAEGILAGVSAAHEQGLVHRDLKPGNILLSIAGGTPVPKITDFGLAKVLGDPSDPATRTRSGIAMGTPAYMAPEQIRDASRVDHRADIWSLGAILYEIASGQRAFTGEDTMELFQAVCAARFTPLEALPKIPKRWSEAVAAALTVELESRAPDCAALTALWTGGGSDTWAAARGIWDQQTLFQVASISTDSVADVPPPADPSEVGTFVMTEESEVTIEEVDGARYESGELAPAQAELAPGKTVEVTRAVQAMLQPVGAQLWQAVMGEQTRPPSWEDAVAFAVLFSEKTGRTPVYELGPWTPRKAYHLDDIGRLLYDRIHFDRIPAVLATFGEKTLEVLQFEPHRLAEVDGIGPKTAARIGAAWDRGLCFHRPITRRDGDGWRLPTEAELALVGPAQWEWTDDGDDGPAWSDVPGELPATLAPDRHVLDGTRRVVRRSGERRALPPEAREEGLGFRLVRVSTSQPDPTSPGAG